MESLLDGLLSGLREGYGDEKVSGVFTEALVSSCLIQLP